MVKRNTSKKKALEVSREGDVILLPTGRTTEECIRHLELVLEHEKSIVDVERVYNILPWAGAAAVQEVLGAQGVPKPMEHRVVTCPSAKGDSPVVFGWLAVAHVGDVHVGITQSAEQRLAMRVTIRTRGILVPKAEELLDKIGEAVKASTFYAGCILEMPAADDSGAVDHKTPPKALPVPEVSIADLILPKTLQNRVRALVLGFIRGKAGRRGILLVGPPGTGKTLTAKIAAREAVKAGRTVLSMADGHGLESVMRFARQCPRALILCEDIDRHLRGSRSSETDRLLQALDGLGSGDDVIVLATSNSVEGLPEALLRDGRFSVKLLYGLPDGESAERMLRARLAGEGPKDLAGFGAQLAGLQPASITAVAELAKDYSSARGALVITDEDLQLAVDSVMDGAAIAAMASTPPEQRKVTHTVEIEGLQDILCSLANPHF